MATAESDLGTILVDGEGLTLYLFMPDAQGPSTCEGDCLAAWPALVGPATAGEGVDESLLATATRADDGSEQVTYNGWPLYYFAQDSAPGDVNGQESRRCLVRRVTGGRSDPLGRGVGGADAPRDRARLTPCARCLTRRTAGA